MASYVQAGGEDEGVTLSSSSLPTDENIDFKDTRFFNQDGHESLPSPDEIREHARRQRRFADPEERPQPVHIRYMKLTVKFGSDINIAEGQCLWAIGKLLKDKVPVPEIYGWRHDGGEVFLYMEHIRGVTLEEHWEALEDAEQDAICEELREMIMHLRSLKQDPNDQFIGSISRQSLPDIIFEHLPKNEVHSTVEEFHDYWSALTSRPHPNPAQFEDPMRDQLPDDAPITFSHADLHPSNIIVSPYCEIADDPWPRVLAIVDWGQSGWYPRYWEFCKAMYTVGPFSKWGREFVSQLMNEPTCVHAWYHYANASG